ncbi:MAG: hypothetical protein Q8T04_02955 [Bacteroidota bacterium]|nr:hypothetical protein [Bacteroidota bacterium]
MASYREHILQAQNNLAFLKGISANLDRPYWDWCVTTCFYVGVHLVNSHIAIKGDLHYRRHDEVSEAISPYNQLSLAKVPDEVYTAYRHLQNLSRRSRYLISEKMGNRGEDAFLTFDKHFQRALRSLDVLLDYITSQYLEPFDKTEVDCGIHKNIVLNNFSLK